MNKCCLIKENKVQHKFKDVVITPEGFYYSVYITYCVCCGKLQDSQCWID